MSPFVKKSPQDKSEAMRQRFLAVWTLIGLGIIFIGLVYLLGILSNPVAVIIWTTIIVFCLREPVAFLADKGVNRVLATVIAYVGLALILFLIGLIVFSPSAGIATQFSDLIEAIPSYVQSFISWAGDIYDKYANLLNNEAIHTWLSDFAASFAESTSSVASQSATGIMDFGTSVVNSVVVIGFSLVIAFWILIELPAIGRECWRLVPDEREEEVKMFHITLTRVMGGYIKATILQCVVIGAVCGVLFAIAGVPSAAVLGLITGILNIIPIVGPWFGGAVAALVGLIVSPFVALVALIGTIVIQQFVYTFISPKIMQNSVDIHPAATLFILLVGSAVGTSLGGIMGALVGALASIPAIAVFKSLFVYYFERNTGRQLVSEDGVFFRGEPTEGNVDPVADAISPSTHHAPHAQQHKKGTALAIVAKGVATGGAKGAAKTAETATAKGASTTSETCAAKCDVATAETGAAKPDVTQQGATQTNVTHQGATRLGSVQPSTTQQDLPHQNAANSNSQENSQK